MHVVWHSAQLCLEAAGQPAEDFVLSEAVLGEL